jgi:protein-S-isoprenylcysteine O-methyltransferase Ste14
MKRIVPAAARAAAATGAFGVDIGLAPRQPAGAARVAPDDFGELLARMAIVAMFTFLAARIGQDFLQTGRATGLLLLASEALVVVLTICRRPTGRVDRSARARVLTTVSLLGPMLLAPAAGAALLPGSVTVALSAAGLLVVVVGKLSLGRSFGLMPANRGVVSTGLYRLVRHPIYLGYLITHAGFLFANPTIWNLATLVVADLALMIRAVCEERVLEGDEAYRAYQLKVRYRVVPGVF